MVATRQRLTWDSLTPASPIDSGDVVDVLIDGMEPIRGVYCGLHAFPSGRAYAEILMADDCWQFVCLEMPHTIRLVRESHSLVIHEERERLDAADNQQVQPFTAREKRATAIAAVCVAMFWLAFFLWAFWR